MPAPTGAHVYKNAVITIDEVEYANQLTRARLVPETPIQTVRTLVPDGVVQDVDSTVWTLELAGLQINTTGGLAKALRDAAGTEVDVIIQPKAGSSMPTAECTVLVTPVPFGGDQGAFLTFEAEYGVVGSVNFATSASGG